MSADTPRPSLITVQQCEVNQEGVTHPQMQEWMTAEEANRIEVFNPSVGGAFYSVNNICEQVIDYIHHNSEPTRNQDVIPTIPSSSSNVCPTKAHRTSESKSAEEQQSINARSNKAVMTPAGSTHSSQVIKSTKDAPDSAGESGSNTKKPVGSPMPRSPRRERHNIQERERRKRIRSYCDELNKLVPLCTSGLDKANTLLRTIAFLRYINQTYGDALKEGFQKSFTDERGPFIKPGPSSDQDLNHGEMEETQSSPLEVEQ